MENETIEINENAWKSKTLLIGGIIGALTGLGTAYLLTQKAEKEGESLSLNSGQGIKLGLLVLGTLRQVLQLDDGQTKGKGR